MTISFRADNMARFSRLAVDDHYDIIDADSGRWITQGIQGADAMATTWDEGDEAWPSGEKDFKGSPVDIAR